MSDQHEQQVKSFIYIEFDELGSAIFNIALNNVTPGQVFAALPALEVKAKNEFLRQENLRLEREANQRLAVPDGKILVGK